MCWTDNREQKVKYFSEIKLWFLPLSTECAAGSELVRTASRLVSKQNSNKNDPHIGNIRDQCCAKKSYWNLKHLNFTD